MKALDERRILAPADLKNLVSFPRYGRLKLEFVLEQINLEQIYKGLNSSEPLGPAFGPSGLLDPSGAQAV